MNPSTSQLISASSPIYLPPTAAISTHLRHVFCLKPQRRGWCCLRLSCTPQISDAATVSSLHSTQGTGLVSGSRSGNEDVNFEVINPFTPASIVSVPKLSFADKTFFLPAFIGCTTCVAFTAFVAAAVPTLFAMRRAALSFAKLADTAREELPSTMAAVRLSGMEISDLTLELSDLSQEIADGVNKSAQAVQAAEAGVQQVGSVAHEQTMTMIRERASLPIISLKPAVAGAAKKTSHAVGQAAKTLLNVISRGDNCNSVGEDGISKD